MSNSQILIQKGELPSQAMKYADDPESLIPKIQGLVDSGHILNPTSQYSLDGKGQVILNPSYDSKERGSQVHTWNPAGELPSSCNEDCVYCPVNRCDNLSGATTIRKPTER